MSVRWRVATVSIVALQSGIACAAAVNGVRVWSGPEATRVVFELSEPVEHRVFSLADPDRLVIDLEDTSVGSTLDMPEAKGAVAAVRTGARPDGELRVVLELTRAVKAKTFLLGPNDDHGDRLVVDLMRPDAATAAAVNAPAVPSAPTSPSVPAPPLGRDLVIAIDAGHGGQDPGASGHRGVREKDVVLAIAKRLADEIEMTPGMHAALTRRGDYYVSLRKRMELAHEAHSDFFISIHADSYRDPSARGSTVYVLSDKGASDEASLLLAQRENAADLLGGVSLADKDQLLARVLLDLSQNAALSASTAAGQRLINRLSGVETMRRSHVQQAPFLVLKSPDIPSVLVETAYITNPREEAALRDPKQQAAFARALRDGIVDYFAANPPHSTYFASHARTAAATNVRHVITRGETLSGIAQRYGVSTSSLRRSNGLKTDLVRIGQVLTIPPG